MNRNGLVLFQFYEISKNHSFFREFHGDIDLMEVLVACSR